MCCSNPEIKKSVSRNTCAERILHLTSDLCIDEQFDTGYITTVIGRKERDGFHDSVRSS